MTPERRAQIDEREALRRANDLFYRSLETLDLDGMKQLWLHSGWVQCVHPGWDVLVGWDSVLRSFEEIFASTGWLRVTPTAVHVEIIGEVGVVSCAENISSQSDGGVGLSVAHATNLFRRTPEGWRMIHHHASPAPVRVTHPFTGTVQ